MRRSAAILFTLSVLTAVGCTEAMESVTETPLTTTDVGAVPSSTSAIADLTLDQMTIADSTGWSEVLERRDSSPIGLATAGDRLFLLVQDTRSDSVSVWTSQTGSDWTNHVSPFPSAAAIATIDGFDGRLEVVTDGHAESKPEFWATKNGIQWEREEVPISHDNPRMRFEVTDAFHDGAVRVVAGHHMLAHDLVGRKLKESLWPGFEPGRDELKIRTLEDDISIDVVGPFGLKLFNTNAAELEISEQEQESIRAGTQSSPQEIWVDDGDGKWERSFIDGASSIGSLAAVGESLLAVGDSDLGGLASWTTDGAFWERHAANIRSSQIERLNDQLVGQSTAEHPDLLASDDGVVWESTGLGDSLPRTQDWFLSSFTETEAGLLALLGFLDKTYQPDHPQRLPRIQKGRTLIQPEGTGRLRMFDGDTDYLWLESVDYQPTELDFDPETETVHFYRDDGSTLATLTLSELTDLELDLSVHKASLDHYRRFLARRASSQGWEIWDLAPLDHAYEPILASTNDSTLVVVGRSTGRQPGFKVWITDSP